MQPLNHNEGATGVGGQVAANGARGLATGTSVGALTSTAVPAGADEVSAHAALAFDFESAQTQGLNTLAQQEVARLGAAVVEISGTYQTVDGALGTTLA